jgi:ABC-type uncharacterized transport system involved in gliding motility auxiliary subunit
MTRLLVSSDDAGLVDSFRALGGSSGMAEGLEPESDMLLAVRLQGNFATAFPDGPPSSETDSEEEEKDTDEEETDEEPQYLQESGGKGVVVLFADVDMLHDRFCVRTLPIFGHQPINDNINMILNFAEQLAGSEALIGLRSRGTYERPFRKVLKLQSEAQARWEGEEQRLQAEVERVQNRINELQAGKDSDQRLVLSSAQRKEIDKFNEEVFRTQQQLREVRKELRRDIEMLGLRVKFLNIAAVPILVAGFGIYRGLRRRKRAVTGV